MVLRAPRPAIRYRWMATKKISTEIVTATPAATINPQSTTAIRKNSLIPMASVFSSSLPIKTSANRKSFQATMKVMRKMLYWGGAIVGGISLGAFLLKRAFRPPRRLAGVPWELTARAVIPGVPGARYLVGVDIEPLVQDVVAARQREEDFLARSGHTGPLPPSDLLVISGGGDNGSFGAGLLCGWTASGNRPTFKSVSGVSTGALIAPLAFLGSAYDGLLRKISSGIWGRLPRAAIPRRSISAGRSSWPRRHSPGFSPRR